MITNQTSLNTSQNEIITSEYHNYVIQELKKTHQDELDKLERNHIITINNIRNEVESESRKILNKNNEKIHDLQNQFSFYSNENQRLQKELREIKNQLKHLKSDKIKLNKYNEFLFINLSKLNKYYKRGKESLNVMKKEMPDLYKECIMEEDIFNQYDDIFDEFDLYQSDHQKYGNKVQIVTTQFNPYCKFDLNYIKSNQSLKLNDKDIKFGSF